MDTPKSQPEKVPYQSSPDDVTMGEVPAADADGVTSAQQTAELAERYDLQAEVGRGGMGVVYRAVDRETSDVVALKVVNPQIAADARVMERFRDELRMARKITHKNVCRMYELLRFRDTAVIAMEFVDGLSLRDVVNRFGGLPLRKAVVVAQQICAALGEAHQQGIIHRDLKPENVMIDAAGNAKLMDFGIARSGSLGDLGLTISGTPMYMSPEQAAGRSVDARSDIYSLGLVLYEVFTGQPAHPPGEKRVFATTPAAPHKVDSTVPEHISQAIMRCLEVEPERRFQRAEELAGALALQASAAVTPELRADLPERLRTWQRRDWVLVAAAVVLAALGAPFLPGLLPYAWFHPAGSAEEARTRALDLWQRNGGILPAQHTESVRLAAIRPAWFQAAVLNYGLRGALRRPEEWAGGWVVSSYETFHYEQGFESRGALAIFDREGRVRSLLLPPRAVGEAAEAPAALPAAAAAAQQLFNVPVEAAAATVFRWDEGAKEWRSDAGKVITTDQSPGRAGAAPVEWSTSDGSRLRLWMNGDHLVAAQRFMLEIPSPWNWRMPAPSFEWRDFVPLVVFPLLFVLFFLRKLWKPRWLAAAVVTVVVVPRLLAFNPYSPRPPELATLAANPSVSGMMGVIIVAIGLVFTFLFSFVPNYVAVIVGHDYLRQNRPESLATLAQLRRGLRAAPAAGFAILRGVLLGAALAGVVCAVLGLLATLRWAAPLPKLISMFAVVGSETERMAYADLAKAAVGSFLDVWLWVALPLALVRKVTARPMFAILAITLVRLATSNDIVAGLSLEPQYVALFFEAAVAAAIGLIAVRFDMLTAICTLFTLEAAFTGGRVLTYFGAGSLRGYAVVVWWVAAVGFGVLLAVRPQLTAATRRTVEVFR